MNECACGAIVPDKEWNENYEMCMDCFWDWGGQSDDHEEYEIDEDE